MNDRSITLTFLLYQVSCKVAVWQQDAHKIAETVHMGTLLRIINPSLVPANPTYSMGASSSVELRILPDTQVEVLSQQRDHIDVSLYVRDETSHNLMPQTSRKLRRSHRRLDFAGHIGSSQCARTPNVPHFQLR